MATATMVRNARALREARRESLDDVRAATGITKGSLQRFEVGITMLRYPALVKLASHYNVAIDVLLEVQP
jgi:transcriptional regulator with XRE-family HTH domain